MTLKLCTAEVINFTENAVNTENQYADKIISLVGAD